jgi:hypothetical protein
MEHMTGKFVVDETLHLNFGLPRASPPCLFTAVLLSISAIELD